MKKLWSIFVTAIVVVFGLAVGPTKADRYGVHFINEGGAPLGSHKLKFVVRAGTTIVEEKYIPLSDNNDHLYVLDIDIAKVIAHPDNTPAFNNYVYAGNTIASLIDSAGTVVAEASLIHSYTPNAFKGFRVVFKDQKLTLEATSDSKGNEVIPSQTDLRKK